MNTLVKLRGVVTRRTAVFPQLKYVKYNCPRCGHVFGPFFHQPGKPIRLTQCPTKDCGFRGKFTVNHEQVLSFILFSRSFTATKHCSFSQSTPCYLSIFSFSPSLLPFLLFYVHPPHVSNLLSLHLPS